MKQFTKKILAGVLASAMLAGATLTVERIQKPTSIYAEDTSHWYSQKGWTYNGKTLTSLCYISSYAMILKSMGYDADPVSVYVANGKSNYCNHSLIAKAFGVDATSETGSIASKSQTEKQKFIKDLLAKYPQGVIVGGNYGGGTHYIVAKKVEKDTIYFDDSAYETEKQGCCIPVSQIYKLSWSTITTYRVIKEKASATNTPSPTVSPKITASPQVTTSVAVTSKPSITQIPKATEIPNAKPASTYNPLGKYTVPTRTIYYKSSVMKGNDVKWVEASLKKLGYSIKVDGKFSKADATIAKKYQKKRSLAADGHVGKKTLQKLIKDIEIAVTKVGKVKELELTENQVQKSSKASEKDRVLSVCWKRVSNASGYVLVYASNKTFSASSKVQKKGTGLSISNLEKEKNYYFKVRAFKTVNGTKVYGAYSDIKKIKIS